MPSSRSDPGCADPPPARISKSLLRGRGPVSKLLPASSDTNHSAATALRVFADMIPSPLHAILSLTRAVDRRQLRKTYVRKGFAVGTRRYFRAKCPKSLAYHGRAPFDRPKTESEAPCERTNLHNFAADPGRVMWPRPGDFRQKAAARWQLVQRYLDRIAAADPKVRSAGARSMPSALKIAQEREREAAKGAIRGALHGVPVAIKRYH